MVCVFVRRYVVWVWDGGGVCVCADRSITTLH